MTFKLRAFEFADALALAIYRATVGSTAQMRCAASIAPNIVEGCARRTEADYFHFLDMVYGSARELEYQMSLTYRIGFLTEQIYSSLRQNCEATFKVLNGLIRSLRSETGD